ncbi:hypothetical protein BaRGS_00031140 [Batillaria attramentaria]|uniref:Amino acid transporter n=1 Tax=Batillaria attramentaria TaxID=370345 RepID=A0ABD0JRM2_9CAEN
MADTRSRSPELQSLTSEKMKAESDEVIIEQTDLKKAFVPKLKVFLRDSAMFFLTIAGIVIGFALGFGVRELNPSKDALMWIGMPGELFLRLLKMMILPLIVCSVITGTASLDPKANGKISAIAFVYIVATNIIACVVAIFLCLIIKPGVGQRSTSSSLVEHQPMETQDIFADLLRNVVPDNMVEATFRKARTMYEKEESSVAVNSTNGTTFMESVITMSKYTGKTDGLIVICTVVGIATNTVKERADVFLRFFAGATDVILVIIRWFFWFTPVGVASLIAVSIAGVDNIGSTFSQLGKFVLAVTVGILLHQFVILPIILVATTRRNPFFYLVSIIRPCVIGFASTSTAVAIPEMLDSCEEKNKIDRRVARFVIPFCVTLNADGSALYITSAAIFIGQLTGADIGAREIIIIGVLTAIAAMAIPSVPSASIVTLVIILTSLNIPVNDIALLFAVEWFLDRMRTPCNVISHTFCAAVTYQFCKNDLDPISDQQDSSDDVTDIVTSPV